MNGIKQEEGTPHNGEDNKPQTTPTPIRRRRGQRDHWPWPPKIVPITPETVPTTPETVPTTPETVPITPIATPSYSFQLHPQKNLFTSNDLLSLSSHSSQSTDEITINHGVLGKVLNSHHKDEFTHPDNLSILSKGGVLFRFSCQHLLTKPYEKEMVHSIANLTSFQNEFRDNYVPHYHERDASKYTFLLTKCCYLLPPIDLRKLCKASFMSTVEYHESCQPDGTFIWKDRVGIDGDTFRITKPIVPHVYNITVQFKVSPIHDRAVLDRLSDLVGMKVHCGLLLERTKRSKPPKQDGTRKAKSVLLYTVDGIGEQMILVNHITIILQTSLPTVVEKVIDKFGQWGLKETCETAVKTRRYLMKTLYRRQ